MATTFTLGFSPCPNDTFIFDALVNGKINTGDLSFEVVLEDVQTLNEWALNGKLDVSKVSYGVYPKLLQEYRLLRSGGALGTGVGPLLVSREANPPAEPAALTKWVSDKTIAIPGVNTTAHFLFSQAFPGAQHKTFKVFHEIETAVLSGAADLGVIIHENRFTYQQKGLHRVLDLGSYWEQSTGLPIPLGGIVAHSRLPVEIIKQLDELIHNSVAYALSNYPLITDFVRQHAQEMDEAVMRQHIDLYVNSYSLDLGTAGEQAVNRFIELASV